MILKSFVCQFLLLSPLERAHNPRQWHTGTLSLIARRTVGTRVEIRIESGGYPGLRRRRTGSCIFVSLASRSPVSHRGALTLKLRSVGHRWVGENRGTGAPTNILTPENINKDREDPLFGDNMWLSNCVMKNVEI